MNGTIASNPKQLLSVTGAVEAATGLVLGGGAVLAGGTAAGRSARHGCRRHRQPRGRRRNTRTRCCVLACVRQDAAGRAARGLIAAMLLYNAGVIAVLVLAWANQGLSGVALWPVVLAHAVLAVWCVVALSAREQQ